MSFILAVPFVEKGSSLYRATMLNEFNVLIGPSSLTALTLTLYNRANSAIINGRNAQNILAGSGVPINGITTYDNLQTDADGVTYNLKWDIVPADVPIIDDTLPIEGHVALFQVTWATGGYPYELLMPVQNLQVLK